MTLSGDDAGFFGTLVAISFMVASFLGAFIIFIMLWRNGKLNFDEEAANLMLEEPFKEGESNER